MNRESVRSALPGYPMILLSLLLAAAAIASLVRAAGTPSAALVFTGLAAIVASIFIAAGLFIVNPNDARVLVLFGTYKGTVKGNGFYWANPFLVKRRITLRARNLNGEKLKVNDKGGNPIQIAAVVVWQVEDTARALYEVDNLVQFVGIQTETAVRHVATSYPYDALGRQQLSLRDNANEITASLSAEIAARVTAGGVHVIESRLTRLAYAPEVAQAKLRLQQADAVVAARRRIVEGAVGMVELALARLDEHDVVELDDERRVSMVSNLLVVLCSDQALQPVVNAGSLYS